MKKACGSGWNAEGIHVVCFLKGKPTSGFLEVHLAHQIVLLFIRQQFCSHDYLGCFVPSSWYPSNQSLLFITSRCSRQQK